MTLLDKLFAYFDGNKSETSRQLGQSRQTINNWCRQGYIPHKQGKLIEKRTKGHIKAIDVWEEANLP